MPPKLAHQLKTEQEILKKFEDLGWGFFRSEGFFGKTLTIEKATLEITIYINMKIYEITQKQIRDGLTMKEHQLLTELFKCYKWID